MNSSELIRRYDARDFFRKPERMRFTLAKSQFEFHGAMEKFLATYLKP